MLLFRSPVSAWRVTSAHADQSPPLDRHFIYPNQELETLLGTADGFSSCGVTVQVYKTAVLGGLHHVSVIAVLTFLNIVLHFIDRRHQEVQPCES